MGVVAPDLKTAGKSAAPDSVGFKGDDSLTLFDSSFVDGTGAIG